MRNRAVVTGVLALCGMAVVGCGAAAGGTSAPALPQPSPAGGAVAEGAIGTAAAATEAAPRAGTSASASAPAEPLAGKVIAIDPGHNGGNYRDPGYINRQVDVLTEHKACDTTGTATRSGYTEAAFNWDVSKRLVKILEARGAKVKLTRTGNTGVGPCITQRAAIGNKAKADAALSVHADGAPSGDHGFHVIMPKKIDGPVDPVVGASRKLGVAIRDAFRSGTGLPYSTYIGSKALDYRDDLGGLNLSTVPKVFVECGNMANPGDAAKFRSPAFRQKIAQALADGLQNYLT
ncbi:hypothetical protein Misp01_77080 [Microtetraspora sp. NBRC 13810]|uniref:N-acetylmuramoyl-L-alanine amidase n=1 Tax=Microtetraspora sp. NBRC 13810 TaxID=3030990 RepID=UPI0024A26AA6|nr:N-acetylmuramoyl-L-alanine amidase [Microtetraspora sp. NBRC 13810]GLW12580.1 hypothetical protein Misp01_77080 [Microtetraspora sp. NBRC 13810]